MVVVVVVVKAAASMSDCVNYPTAQRVPATSAAGLHARLPA